MNSSDPIQEWFGLSYNPYLVVPRSVLDAMGPEWQTKLMALLNEMMETEPAKQSVGQFHYLVQRTDPARDDEIGSASIRGNIDAPDPIFIKDPFANYRHPPQVVHDTRKARCGGWWITDAATPQEG